MSDVIKRIEKFSFYNNNAIQSHLESMALKGYRLISIDKSIWTYKVIKPRPIKYRITYFEDQSLIFHDNPYIKRTEEDFFSYCRNVGWTLAGQWGKMQIFYTATDEYREIETDYKKELIALKTIVRRKTLPSTMALSFLAVCQGFYQMVQYVNYPLKNISNPTFVLFSFIWILLFLAGLFSVSGYSSWSKKAEVTIKKNNKYPVDNDIKYKWSLGLLWGVLIIFVAQSLILAFKFSTSFAYIFVSQIIISLMFARRMRIKHNNNEDLVEDISDSNIALIKNEQKIRKFVTIWLSVTFVITFILNGITTLDWLSLEPETPTQSIEIGDVTLTYDMKNNNIPLKIEDLVDINSIEYGYELDVSESIFAKYIKAKQYSFDISAPVFDYEVITLKNNIFYNTCLDYYLSPYIYNNETSFNVYKTDDPVWEANKVYQVFDNTTPVGIYIICYDDKIIYYNGFDVLNSQQAEIVFEKLKH